MAPLPILKNCDLRPRSSYVSRVGRRFTWSSRCISISMKRNGPSFGPRHWRQRAQATLTKAESFECQKSKAKLLKIAEEYQRLEWRAAERERLTDVDEEQ